MKHGLWLRTDDSVDVAQLVEFGAVAEEAGWDGVFVSDSLPVSEYPDPWVLLAGIASRTQDIRLGTWVVPIPRRQPWQVAQEAATLDQLSDGRVILGAGLGEAEEYEPFTRQYEARQLGERFDEALEVITGLWKDELFSYNGDHFTLRNAEVQPTPVQQPRIPILLAGLWPNKKPFRRGARWDGVMPVGQSYPEQQSEEELREMMAYYRKYVDEEGDILLAGDLPGTPPDFIDLCEELDITWVLTTGVDSSEYTPGEYTPQEYTLDIQQIRNGPPG